MPEQIPRRPFWLAGRLVLALAALTIPAAFLIAPRRLPDKTSSAIAGIQKLHAAESAHYTRFHRFSALVQTDPDYTFTATPKSQGYVIVAIPVDPRQKSFYSDETKTLRVTPGTQAPHADRPSFGPPQPGPASHLFRSAGEKRSIA